ncbi:hypothetical protein JCM8097_008192 [Rhodosporidiobolus ruineniae]
MSTPADPFWPQVGSVWRHWSDLLVATQLAALRAGFSGVNRVWDKSRPREVKFACAVVDSAHPSALWQVTRVYEKNFTSQIHQGHLRKSGLSANLQVPLRKHPKVTPKVTVLESRGLHNLEGAIRAQARRQGRFVKAFAASSPKTYTITCALMDHCPFVVRFEQKKVGRKVAPRWICVGFNASHTCVSEADRPQPELLQAMEFFPDPNFRPGPTVKAKLLRVPSAPRPAAPQTAQIPSDPSSTSAPPSAVRCWSSNETVKSATAVEMARRTVLTVVKKLERQEKELRKMTDAQQIETASRALIVATQSFLTGSYAHLQALLDVLEKHPSSEPDL